MTKKEVEKFLLKIKSYYQNFSIENYIVDEWYLSLKKYDAIDVYRKLDLHLNGEYADRLPQLHFITKYLKTSADKQKVEKRFCNCRVCGKLYENLDEWNLCEERCRRIGYLLKLVNKYDLNLESNLTVMKIEEINQVYDKIFNYLKTKKYEKLDEIDKKAVDQILDLSFIGG